MASKNESPAPASSSAVSPTTSTTSTSTTNSPPPTSSQLNQTTTPSNSSSPPPQSPPPPPAAPPPSPPISSPPPPISSPPPLSSTPPSSSPPASLPPPPPNAPPPVNASSPPPSIVSTPPPVSSSLPPQASPTPPVGSPPPPPQAVSPSSPPPPANLPAPPTSQPPPPPKEKAPKHSPPPSNVTSPSPTSQSSSPPPAANAPPPPPPASSLPSPPSSVPSTSSPSPVKSPSVNSSTSASPAISPSMLSMSQKPTARSTDGTDDSANTTSTKSGGLSGGGVAAIGIVVGFVVLSLIVMVAWFAQKRKRKGTKSGFENNMPSPFVSSQNSDSVFISSNSVAPHRGSPLSNGHVYSPSESGGLNQSKSWFTCDELVRATNGFSTQNLLGEGGFGCVYKGVLEDGREVAVKQLKVGGSQGEREFRAEVEIISRIHHRHLVSLVGYCISEQQRLLVYEYVPNDTLHYHLHSNGRAVMDWATRLKVAAGSARGLAYLHEDCHPRIIHRDIKSSNILLDSNFEARVADFGLAKLAQELDSNTHVSTRVMGTFGYMAPEYATSGKLTEKSDIYSFGVMLLELITGRKPVDASRPLGDESLVEWARPLLTEALENEDFEALADPMLEGNYDPREMFRMIEAAAACVRHSAAKRPRMSQVARALDSVSELSDLSNGMKPGQSEILDPREQSAQIRLFQRLAFGSQDYSSDYYYQSQSSWRSRDPGDQSSSVR